ncbi:hypothetical protein EUX98_g1775 [Antrodiella citrinella]|uniref:Cytochrome P450 n=1 Tax=Antrodiella citrinella TaxID=2447956 RepID=A0A4V3XJA9_9APHY|nr:hypothetical protein EUX98_g1775 [Antrodiella citrinella]
MDYSPIYALAEDFSFRDALLVDVSLALLAHLILNRFEPHAIPVLTVLLIIHPVIATLLLLSHVSTLASLGIAFGVYHATLLSSIAFYRVSPFHPLARYPGPVLLKLSSLWVYEMGISGKRHLVIQKMHEQYNSEVIRIGPNELSFRNASSISQIMGTQGLPKGPAYDGRTSYSKIKPLIAWRDASIHAQRRRSWTRGMSTSALKEYEPALAERITQLVDGLLNSRGETTDMVEWLRFFSYDFMGDMAFGGVSDLMRNGDVHGQMRALRTGIDSAIIVETFPWLTRYVASGVSKLRASAAVQARKRLTKEDPRRDLFYYLNNDDGADPVSPPISTVTAEAMLVTLAGSDTTSGTLSSILYLLMRHPHIYKRLQAEVDTFYPRGENALGTMFHVEMSFLDAVINEALRLYPVILSGSQRATQGEGKVVDSHYIPPHTSVRSHTWSIHRDPRNFYPSPDDFWPERWLIAENPSSYKDTTFIHNANAFIPFSFGPSNCVGKNLAMKEMKMVLCHLLQQVNIRFAEGYNPDTWDDHIKDYFTLEVGQLPVIVTPRGAMTEAR